MEGGADINQAMMSGSSPLWIAFQQGHEDVAKYLYGIGARDALVKVSER